MNEPHPIREDELDAYALGVLDAAEEQAVEQHLATCATCARSLETARGRVAVLALAAEQVAPPPAVKERLMQSVRESLRADAAASQPALERKAPSFWGWAHSWAAAAVACAAAAIFFWNANVGLRAEIRKFQSLVVQQIEDIARYRAVAALATSNGTVAVSLTAPPRTAPSRGRVLYNQSTGALVYSGTLAQLETGKSYELWIIPQTGNPIPAGVFAPQASGEASVVLPSIPTGVAFKAFAITVEPAGGGPQPTGPMVQLSM